MVASSHSYGFSSSHVWMLELDYKESWALKNWFFWTVVFSIRVGEDSWESLGLQGDPTSPSWGNHPEYSLEGLMLKLQYFGYLMQRTDSFDPDAGKDWGLEEKGMTEDEMVDGIINAMDMSLSIGSGSWWWTGKPGVLQSMGCKESDMTERLNWSLYNLIFTNNCV